MIAGIGLDLTDVQAFARLLDEPGSRLRQTAFTEAERLAATGRPSGDPALHLAARWAAKEACVKALSQALAPRPLPAREAAMIEVEVLSDADGRPRLALSGALRRLAEDAGVSAIHVSLTHEGPMAAAVVVLERAG